MGDQQRVGFEDLLKPVKDVLLKNWRMSLAHVLDEFISHLQNEGTSMNFSQAAILLQNSTTFYCKRVDVVFRIVEELTGGITQLYMAIFGYRMEMPLLGERIANNEEASGSTSSRKKRVARTLENDDLELLDFVNTDSNIDLNWQKFLNAPPPKRIVLNKDVKAPKKPDTVVPLVGSNDIFMGYKDDYRLFGKTWSDGTINDDFFNSNHEVSFWRGSEVEVNVDSHCDDQMDTCEPQAGLSNGFPTSPEVEESSNVPENSVSFNDIEHIPLKELKIALWKAVDWDPVTYEFQFPLKVLKRRRVFALPKRLIEEAEEELERQKKRKLSRKKKAAKLVNGMTAEIMNGLDQTIDEVVNHYSRQPVSEDVVAIPTDVDSECSLPPNGDSEISRFKQQRRESGLLATEVARRVAEWHEAVLPKVQEAEERRKFNVHEYGTRLLEKFPDTDQNYRPFSELVEGQPKPEICRHFLSCLMLANTYNVMIRKSDNTPLATDCLELKLLSKVRHHDEMDEQLESLS